MKASLSEQFFPEPQDGDGTDDTENEVREVALAEEFNLQEVADESADIAAYDTDNEVDDTSLALAAHEAVGKVADEDSREDWPSCEICKMF